MSPRPTPAISTSWPAPYPEINALLARLLAELESTLGAQFIGFYLHGSLASGDFEPGRSDIDLLVVTAGELAPQEFASVQSLHRRLAQGDSIWARRMEGPYIPRQRLRRYDPQHNRHPALSMGGRFAVDTHNSDWIIQRHLLRQYGIPLKGPPLVSLIDPVSPAQLRRAACDILQEWWQPQLTDPSRLRSAEYQAYAILTMCRSAYTIRRGDVVSKPLAARWAKAELWPDWAGLIDAALAWRHGMPLDRLEETLALIRAALARCNDIVPPTASG